MTDCTPVIQKLLDPDPTQWGNSIEEFLTALAKPTWITLTGKDQNRSRAICTLLHGNEPSGTIALLHWLKQQQQPATNLHLFIANIKAALTAPPLTHRFIPGSRDLNRCFRAPYDDDMGTIARALLDLLWEYRPEALLDIHNTSGSGPSFAVAVNGDSTHKALASLFTQRLIVTDLRLGALMELSEQKDHIPTATIECGGSYDRESHSIAYEGIERYINQEDVMHYDAGIMDLEILHKPMRLEAVAEASITYEENIKPGVDICLRPNIENYNFGVVNSDACLGLLGDKGLTSLRLISAEGEKQLSDFFQMIDRQLFPVKPLKLFMITMDANIAKNDCILYAIEAD